MQWLADTNQFGEFYNGVRKLLGTTPIANMSRKTAFSEGLLTSKPEVLLRWAEHFNTLLNVDQSVDMEYVRLIPQLFIAKELDDPLSRAEVIFATIKKQTTAEQARGRHRLYREG